MDRWLRPAATFLESTDLRNGYVWVALTVTIAYGAIGFLDDYRKVIRRDSKGLPGKAKLLLQVINKKNTIPLQKLVWLLY